MRSLTEADLRDAQRIAIPFMLENKKCALFADMGLGKTGAVLMVLRYLLNRFLVGNVLIVAPLRVARKTWPDELRAWLEARELTYEVLWGAEPGDNPWSVHGERRIRHFERKLQKLSDELLDLRIDNDGSIEAKKRMRKLTREVQIAKRTLEWGRVSARRPAEIHIINRDNLIWLVAFWGKYWPYDTVIYDESSGLKSGKKAKRWRAMRMAMPHIDRLVELTGTPAPNGLMDLWGQMYLLDGGDRLGRTITDYRNAYFVSDYDGYKWELRPGAAEEIYGKIQDICLTLRAADFMDLPPTIQNRIPVVLEDADWKLYKKLEKEFIVELTDGGEIVASTAATLKNKLLQLANGIVYDSDKKPHTVHTAMLDAMEEVVDELQGRNLLIAYWYKPDLAAIKKRFPQFVELSDDDRVQDDWNEGKIPGLLVHPASCGHGLNIQFGGRDVLWYGPIWDLELYDQLNKRIDGARATGTTFIHHLIVAGSVHEYVMDVLEAKDRTQNNLLDSLKRLVSCCA